MFVDLFHLTLQFRVGSGSVVPWCDPVCPYFLCVNQPEFIVVVSVIFKGFFDSPWHWFLLPFFIRIHRENGVDIF